MLSGAGSALPVCVSCWCSWCWVAGRDLLVGLLGLPEHLFGAARRLSKTCCVDGSAFQQTDRQACCTINRRLIAQAGHINGVGQPNAHLPHREGQVVPQFDNAPRILIQETGEETGGDGVLDGSKICGYTSGDTRWRYIVTLTVVT
jgi:hypothetical protein